MEKTFNRNIRVLKTLLLVLTWVVMGMSASSRTSTLPDLRTRLNTTVEGLSYAFTISSIGGMVGALSSGIVDRLFIYSEMIIGILMVFLAFIIALQPFMPTVLAFGFCMFLDAVNWVLINAAGNVLVLSLWGESAGGGMQAMHFGYPVGALLGGLIAMPFVSKNCTDNMTDACSDGDSSVDNDFLDDSNIEIAFAICGTCCGLVGLVHIGVHFFKIPLSREEKNSEWRDLISPSKWAAGDSKFGIIVVSLLCLFYFFMAASMLGVEQYIVTYAVDSGLGFSNAEAAMLNSVINAMGGLGRAVFIPLANYFSAMIILLIACHGQFIGAILLATFGTSDKIALWITCSCYTFFRDPFFPAAYSWGNFHILLLAFIIGFTNVIASISNTVMNLLQGYLYTNTVPESVFYTCVLFCANLCIVVYGMYFATRGHHGRQINMDKQVDVEETETVQYPNTEKEYVNTVMLMSESFIHDNNYTTKL